MKKTYRKERILFRFVNLTNDKLEILKQLLPDHEFEIGKNRNTKKGLVALFELKQNQKYDEIIRFIHQFEIPSSDYGLWISLVTDNDNGGVHVPPYAIELFRKTGGDLDFSFVVVG